MPPAIPALIGAGATLIASNQASQGQRRIARAEESAAKAQLAAAKRAQDLLQKRVDESVSDSEAAQLRAEGLIDEGAERRINEINQSTEGFVQNIQNLQIDFRSDEESILQSFVENGVFTREELESGALENIANTAGFTDRAIAAFSPFNEAGKRALRQIQFDTGQLTPEEQEQFRTEFGIEEGGRPQSAIAKAAQTATDRRLKALGLSGSGAGIDEFGKTAATVEAKEQEQRGRIATQGLEAAGAIASLEANRGQDVLGLRERLRANIANQRINEADKIRLLEQDFSRSQLGLGTLSTEQQRLDLQNIGLIGQQRNTDLANLATTGASERGTIRIGGAENIGRIGQVGANLAGPNQIAAAESRGAADLLPIQGLQSAISTVGSAGFFNPQAPQPELVGPRRPGL